MIAAGGAAHSGAEPHPGMISFFALMLISIAVMPLWKPDWWHHNYPKVAVGLGTITDSLAAIKYHVFDEKTFSIEEVLDALRADFDGFDAYLDATLFPQTLSPGRTELYTGT